MIPIVIPLHHGGGKLKDNSELRFALRSLERHFKDPFEVVIVGRSLPSGFQGLKHLPCNKGLKSALKVAAAAYPAGFFWFYDDCCLLHDLTGVQMKITPACKDWRKAQTPWSRKLKQIKERLEREGQVARDYSRPHGPYWFDKSMVEEGFRDWPKMAAKFPWESWILSKRKWPRVHGVVKQYYGRFSGGPGERARYLNYNDKGFTPELRAWLGERFPESSRFEKAYPEVDDTIRATAHCIHLPGRSRWEKRCIDEMCAVGIDAKLFEGVDGHAPHDLVMPVNESLFRREFRRDPLPGEIGCYESHVKLSRCVRDLPPVSPDCAGWWLVFEDDAVPVNISGAWAVRIAQMATQQGYDVVMLHTGRKDRRGSGPTRITKTNGKDVFTHAYLLNEKSADEISKWVMRHPIDHAISKSKKLKVGVLWGNRRFDQRPPMSASFSIHAERKACYAGRTFMLPRPDKEAPPEIVKKIHQVWIQGEFEMPEEYRDNRALWKAEFPDFELVLWDEESAKKQWPEFAAATGKCYHHATRADLILARALRDFGGLATGTDCRPNNSSRLRGILEVVDSFLVMTPGREEVSNGLQWSAQPNHPFWKCVCNHQLRDRGRHLGRRSVSSATGPKCYHEAFHAHMWGLHVITAPAAFTRDWNNGWENPNALIDPGFAASWTK